MEHGYLFFELPRTRSRRPRYLSCVPGVVTAVSKLDCCSQRPGALRLGLPRPVMEYQTAKVAADGREKMGNATCE